MTEPALPPRDDDDFQAAEFALGLAEGEALTVARERARRDPEFAARVALWQERFVAMTDGIAPVEPPKRVKKRLFAQLFPKKRVPLMERLWVWKGLTLAALLALAYVAMPTLRPPAPDQPGPIFATQMRGDVDDLELLAVVDPARGELALRRLAGAAPDGRVLELWAILPDQDPISLGLLPEGESLRLALPEALSGQVPALTLAVTDEPPGGSPTGGPTGTIRALGTVNEI
jgi:anti-sigma-K factor RskA